jgi:glycosyltransferase involved in cell wall biosynthesis
MIHISYPVGPWLGNWTLRSIRRTHNLIACSEYVRQSALDHGVQRHQIETLLHGADLHEYFLPKDRKWLHDWLGWPEDCPIIVTVSRIDPYKGHPDLVRAFAIAHQQMPQLRLVICGTGTTGTGYEQMIRQLVVELGISSSTAFLGFQQDLPHILAGADIFCLPTQFDALPLVFLEAMSAGLPVVAARSGGVTELVVEGETGLLVDPGDVDGLAAHLLTLACNPELAKNMGEAGMMRARRNFEPKRIASQWTDILCRRLGPKLVQQSEALEEKL